MVVGILATGHHGYQPARQVSQVHPAVGEGLEMVHGQVTGAGDSRADLAALALEVLDPGARKLRA